MLIKDKVRFAVALVAAAIFFGIIGGMIGKDVVRDSDIEKQLQELILYEECQGKAIELTQEKIKDLDNRLSRLENNPDRHLDRDRTIKATRTISAYCLDSNTAMGKQPTVGKTIATSSKYPFGTKVIIDGHEWTVEDRGGPLIEGDKRMDIYLDTRQECIEWGIPKKEVTIILPERKD